MPPDIAGTGKAVLVLQTDASDRTDGRTDGQDGTKQNARRTRRWLEMVRIFFFWFSEKGVGGFVDVLFFVNVLYVCVVSYFVLLIAIGTREIERRDTFTHQTICIIMSRRIIMSFR